jgi:hypothetical protein
MKNWIYLINGQGSNWLVYNLRGWKFWVIGTRILSGSKIQTYRMEIYWRIVLKWRISYIKW